MMVMAAKIRMNTIKKATLLLNEFSLYFKRVRNRKLIIGHGLFVTYLFLNFNRN